MYKSHEGEHDAAAMKERYAPAAALPDHPGIAKEQANQYAADG